MRHDNAQRWMKLEVAACFVLPVWAVLVGTVFLPVTAMGMFAGASAATVHAMCTIAGIGGVWALYRTVKYCFGSASMPAPNWSVVIALGGLGLLALWIEMTGFLGFTGEFEINWFSAGMTVPPTLCAIHLLTVAIRKQKSEAQQAARNA